MSSSSVPDFNLDETGRYRLYVASACVFAHRVRLVRSLLLDGLGDVFQMSWVTSKSKQDGWLFEPAEAEFGATSMKQVYLAAGQEDVKKASVPLIVDRTTKQMVANDSMDICLALINQVISSNGNGENNAMFHSKGVESLAKEIASKVTMEPYKFLMMGKKPELAKGLFAELDKYEHRLENQPYLFGDQISLADCILWITLIRYDNVYERQFQLEGKHLKSDYPNLTAFCERIWTTPSKSGSGKTLGEEANLPDAMRLYWESEDISALAGNDPKSKVPEIIPVF